MSGQDFIKVVSIGQTSMASELERAGYRKMGIQVVSKDSFSSAKKLLEEGEGQLLVMTADDDQLDFEAAIKLLKSNENTKDIPVILTSVQSSSKIKKKAIQSGADQYLELPIPRGYFVEKIKGMLSKQVRSNDRIEFTATVSLLFDGQELKAEVGDVSPNGICIITEVEFPEMKEVEVSLRLPVSKDPLVFTGEVVRSGDKLESEEGNESFVAVKFTKYKGKSRELLAKFVRKYHHDSELKYYI